jgi:hypothetical protein
LDGIVSFGGSEGGGGFFYHTEVTLFKGIIKFIQRTNGYNGIKYFTEYAGINFGLALGGLGFGTEYAYNLPW